VSSIAYLSELEEVMQVSLVACRISNHRDLQTTETQRAQNHFSVSLWVVWIAG
jgi:hypothetical protein